MALALLFHSQFGAKSKFNCHRRHLTVGLRNDQFRIGRTIGKYMLEELIWCGTERRVLILLR